jgi:hypothetical protein
MGGDKFGGGELGCKIISSVLLYNDCYEYPRWRIFMIRFVQQFFEDKPYRRRNYIQHLTIKVKIYRINIKGFMLLSSLMCHKTANKALTFIGQIGIILLKIATCRPPGPAGSFMMKYKGQWEESWNFSSSMSWKKRSPL